MGPDDHVNCGAGDKMAAKQVDIYGLDRTCALDQALAAAGLTSESIDFALATHLHFDHFGGATMLVDGVLRPRFSRARYLIRDAEWEDATHPHERNRASYLQEDFVPLEAAGVVDLFSGDSVIKPGVRVERTGGHTGQRGEEIVYIESGGRTGVFVVDLIPTTAHLQDAWIMGYEPVSDGHAGIEEAVHSRSDRTRVPLIFFEHDPMVAAGYIREKNGKRFVEQVL